MGGGKPFDFLRFRLKRRFSNSDRNHSLDNRLTPAQG